MSFSASGLDKEGSAACAMSRQQYNAAYDNATAHNSQQLQRSGGRHRHAAAVRFAMYAAKMVAGSSKID